MSYVRFGLMILTSTVVMFILMYLNTYALEHVFFSETRTYMAIMMGATMAVVMLAYMLGMYKNMPLNIAIFIAAGIAVDGTPARSQQVRLRPTTVRSALSRPGAGSGRTDTGRGGRVHRSTTRA